MARLILALKGSAPTEVEVPGWVAFTIGREEENMLVLEDGDVSRFHAQIERLGDGFFVVDLGSTNGTRLNGQKVWGKAALKKNDRIGIGKFEMIFVDEPSDYGPAPKGGDSTAAMPGG